MTPLILVSEADPAVRDVLEMALMEAGFEIVLVEPKKARRLLTEQDFGLAILDIGMAKAAMEPVRVATRRGVKLILMTADPGIRDEIAASGHPHLFKPFAMAELLRLVAAALGTVTG